MTSLKKPLPESIFWLTEKVESLAKPGALLVEDPKIEIRPGMTRLRGYPDVPSDAGWAQWIDNPALWNQSPYDGEAFWLQLDMADIPDPVRKPNWPKVGIVWVFLDLRSDMQWKASVKFDPRPAELIPWKKGIKREIVGCRFDLIETVPDCTEKTLPEIAYVDDMAQDYFDWAEKTYLNQKTKAQLGGWIWPIQGNFDKRNEDFVLALTEQCFGDNGALYLHYDQISGFYALVETH